MQWTYINISEMNSINWTIKMHTAGVVGGKYVLGIGLGVVVGLGSSRRKAGIG